MRRPLFFLLLAVSVAVLRGGPVEPVNPDASPEARALLQLLYDLSGRHTLTGQHNYPNTKSRNTDFAAAYIGKTPVIWGSDWGHSKQGDGDSFLARPEIVKEAIRQHERGSIIALCWHAVPPTADEPVTFMPQPGSDPHRLTSVQGRLLDQQFQDVLTPGTALYAKWCSQVDEIAVYLKQLQDAHVPVLWRPYHEMNGSWFWWGGRTGTYSTKALYVQIFNRLVHVHHLNNLVWVWNVDRPTKPGMEHEKYFPGSAYCDVLSLDVYGSDFAQSYYDSLVSLAQGKPIALSEIGNPPSPEILERQPRWTFYMTWAGMVRLTTRKAYDALLADPRILNLEDPVYAEVTASYRRACGLPVLHFEPKRTDFNGEWVYDENQGKRDVHGGLPPADIIVSQSASSISLKLTRVLEFTDDAVSTETFTLDGAPTHGSDHGVNWDGNVTLNTDGTALVFTRSLGLHNGKPVSETQTWTLDEGGARLTQQVDRAGGDSPGHTVLVYRRR